jgi:hypothetical protein
MASLDDLRYNYARLRAGWEKARAEIVRSSNALGPNSQGIAIIDPTADDELRFMFFGALAYVRFKHNFEDGFLEYGALRPNSEKTEIKYIMIKALKYDFLGSVEGHWNFDNVGVQSFSTLHLRTLAENAAAIVRAYFDLPEPTPRANMP